MSADTHPQLLTSRGLLFFFSALAFLLVVGTDLVLSFIYLSIIAVKLCAPVVNWASRVSYGILADILFCLGFLLPHVPSVIAVWVLNLPTGSFQTASLFYPLGVVACILLNAASLRKMLFSGLLGIMPPKALLTIAGNSASGFLSGASQECLYRGVVLTIFGIHGATIQIVASTAGFVGEHYANRWSKRDFRLMDYARQSLISILCCVVAIVTGGYIAPLILHIGYNSVPAFCDFYHLWLHRQNNRDLHNA